MNSFLLAKENNLKSISFPGISTGVYGYPKKEACGIAITTALEFMEKQDYEIEVYFVLYDKENYDLYVEYLRTIV